MSTRVVEHESRNAPGLRREIESEKSPVATPGHGREHTKLAFLIGEKSREHLRFMVQVDKDFGSGTHPPVVPGEKPRDDRACQEPHSDETDPEQRRMPTRDLNAHLFHVRLRTLCDGVSP